MTVGTEMTQSNSPLIHNNTFRSRTNVPGGELANELSARLMEAAEHMIGTFESQGIPREQTEATLIEHFQHALIQMALQKGLLKCYLDSTQSGFIYGLVKRPAYLEVDPTIYEEVPPEHHKYVEQFLDRLSGFLVYTTHSGVSYEKVKVFLDFDEDNVPCMQISVVSEVDLARFDITAEVQRLIGETENKVGGN